MLSEVSNDLHDLRSHIDSLRLVEARRHDIDASLLWLEVYARRVPQFKKCFLLASDGGYAFPLLSTHRIDELWTIQVTSRIDLDNGSGNGGQ